MKSSGTQYWESPNTAADNSSGFSGLPGGNLIDYGIDNNTPYSYIGASGDWWSSSQNTTALAWTRNLHYTNGLVLRLYDGKQNGFSVRCLRD